MNLSLFLPDEHKSTISIGFSFSGNSVPQFSWGQDEVATLLQKLDATVELYGVTTKKRKIDYCI